MRNLQSPQNTSVTESVNLQTGPGAASGYELTSSALTPLVSSYNAVVQTKPGGGIEFGGEANLASPYGTLDLFLSPGSAFSTIGGSLAGAVVSTPKGTFFTQAVQDAYALVDTGVPDASVYLSGQYVGTTSGNGAMVVPFLQSHLDNNINVSNRGLSVAEVLQGRGSVDTAPGYHNGTFVGTPVERVHAVVAKLLVRSAGIDVIPMYGDAHLAPLDAKTELLSPIDGDGRVYFQGVAPGSYRLTISVSGKTCSMTLDVPEFAAPTYDLGTVRCATPVHPEVKSFSARVGLMPTRTSPSTIPNGWLARSRRPPIFAISKASFGASRRPIRVFRHRATTTIARSHTCRIIMKTRKPASRDFSSGLERRWSISVSPMTTSGSRMLGAPIGTARTACA